YDVFVNVAGGVRIDEPAADLGMAVAIVSSLRDVPADSQAVVIGEVGLGGEIRRIHQLERRVAEATKLGFKHIVVPSQNLSTLSLAAGVEIVEVETVEQAFKVVMGAG
ncbi:MAG: magnesium chelatase domain-containing protein, partial [Bacteroidota bacterium]